MKKNNQLIYKYEFLNLLKTENTEKLLRFFWLH